MRRGEHEVEVGTMQDVRQALADGRTRADDEIWDALAERWRPIGEVVAETPPLVAPPSGSPAAHASAASRTSAAPVALEPPSEAEGASVGREAPKTPGGPATTAKTRRRKILIIAGVAVLAVAVGLLLVLRPWQPSNAELNRNTLDERVKQDQMVRERGANYAIDTYRLRWQDDPDDPLATYLYVRVAQPENREQLLLACVNEHPGYAWCADALSWYYRGVAKWQLARGFADQAAAAFGATDILNNRNFLVAASGQNYRHWKGGRMARVECGRYDKDALPLWQQTGIEDGGPVPEGAIKIAWLVADIREKGFGYDCPELCERDPSLVVLCFDVEVRPAGTVGNIRLRLDNGESFNAITSPGSEADGHAVVGICVPMDRQVSEVTQVSGVACSGGVLANDVQPAETLDQVWDRWYAAAEQMRRELRRCEAGCSGLGYGGSGGCIADCWNRYGWAGQ